MYFFEEAARSLFSGFTHNALLACCLINAGFSLYAKSKHNTLRVSPRKRLNVGSGLPFPPPGPTPRPRAASAAAAGAVAGGDPSWTQPAGVTLPAVRARSPAPAGRERSAAGASSLPSLLNADASRAPPASSSASRKPRRPRSAARSLRLPPRLASPTATFAPPFAPSAGRTSASFPTAPRPGPSLSPLGAPLGPPGRSRSPTRTLGGQGRRLFPSCSHRPTPGPDGRLYLGLPASCGELWAAAGSGAGRWARRQWAPTGVGRFAAAAPPLIEALGAPRPGARRGGGARRRAGPPTAEQSIPSRLSTCRGPGGRGVRARIPRIIVCFP